MGDDGGMDGGAIAEVKVDEGGTLGVSSEAHNSRNGLGVIYIE